MDRGWIGYKGAYYVGSTRCYLRSLPYALQVLIALSAFKIMACRSCSLQIIRNIIKAAAIAFSCIYVEPRLVDIHGALNEGLF